MAAEADPVRFTVGDDPVSGLWLRPPRAIAAAVLAHGAGAGMRHSFLSAVAEGLAARRIATLRYNFPYMEAGRKRPDAPAVAVAAVGAAVAEAGRLAPKLPLVAGGKSFGGRMTSTAAAGQALPRVRGVFFLGFPLHPPGRPGITRAEHLRAVALPMLFLQGTRDDFADLALLTEVVAGLGQRAELTLFDGADHSFHLPKSAGRTDRALRDEMLDALAAWAEAVVGDDGGKAGAAS